MDDYDEDYGDDYGDEWLYVEDYYDEADQLAEYTCPSPNYTVDVTGGEEEDMFDYWADMDYLSDGGYHDNEDPDAPRKRRRTDVNTTPAKSKRRKTSPDSAATPTYQPVLWMSWPDREKARLPTSINKLGKLKTIGLMRDWETKTQDQNDLVSFPEDDFQLQDSQEGEEGDGEGEGMELNAENMAELLSGENLEAIKKMMAAQGMDADAVDAVLKDMLEGKERTFSDEDEGDEDEEAQANEAEHKEHGKVFTDPAPTTKSKGSVPQAEAGSSAQGSRRRPRRGR